MNIITLLCVLNALHGIEIFLILVHFIEVVLPVLHYEYKDLRLVI